MDRELIANDIITVEDIYTILNDYRIGKKPLSKLLGWGETTIIRYVEGDIPTAEYSDKLKQILNNPNYFYSILIKNSDKITKVAYKKCRKAVITKMLDTKIAVIAQYIVNNQNGKISLYELQNMLYYVQGFYMALYDKPIFQDDYLINDTYLPYERVDEEYLFRNISIKEMESEVLDDEEKELIDQVVKAFLWYGPLLIKNLTSYEFVMMRIARDRQNRKIIDQETMKAHFKDIVLLYGISSPRDIHKYPDQRFFEVHNVI